MATIYFDSLCYESNRKQISFLSLPLILFHVIEVHPTLGLISKAENDTENYNLAWHMQFFSQHFLPNILVQFLLGGFSFCIDLLFRSIAIKANRPLHNPLDNNRTLSGLWMDSQRKEPSFYAVDLP